KPQTAPHPQPSFTPPGRAPIAERPVAPAAAAASTGRSSPLDSAIAEILARQSALESGRAAPLPPLSTAAVTPATAPAFSGQMSALEQQLAKISSRIEALHQPAQV
ncbi:hypothetical protein B5P43_37055, partial [Bacillus sp. SRB_336]